MTADADGTEPAPGTRGLAKLGLTPPERHRLTAARLGSVEALWRRAAANPPERLGPLSEAVGIERGRLADLLVGAADGAKERFGGGWLARHWLDAAVTAAVVLALVLGARARAVTGAPRATLAVDVPAYTVLRREHVALPRGADSAALLRALVGRVTLAPLPRGTTPAPDRLGPAVADDGLAGRRVLTIPLSPGASAEALPPGSRADLLLSPRAGSPRPGALVEDVLVLRTTMGDAAPTLLAAVPAGAVAVLADRLGSSEVVLSQRTAPAVQGTVPPR